LVFYPSVVGEGLTGRTGVMLRHHRGNDVHYFGADLGRLPQSGAEGTFVSERRLHIGKLLV
jgi:hypothetical protein